MTRMTRIYPIYIRVIRVIRVPIYLPLEQVIVGSEDFELGAAVYLVGYLLLLRRELLDERGGERVALVEEVVLARHLLVDDLRDALTVTLGFQAVGGYATLDEVVHDRLGAALGEALVVLVRALAVGVCT